MIRRALLIGLAALLVGGCLPNASAAGRLPPAPAAGDDTGRQVVARTAQSVTVLPASPRGAAVGTDYAYAMPMCGTAGPIDVDGSFWDAIGDGSGLDSQLGTFRLTDPDSAQFVTASGRSIVLTRHAGVQGVPHLLVAARQGGGVVQAVPLPRSQARGRGTTWPDVTPGHVRTTPSRSAPAGPWARRPA